MVDLEVEQPKTLVAKEAVELGERRRAVDLAMQSNLAQDSQHATAEQQVLAALENFQLGALDVDLHKVDAIDPVFLRDCIERLESHGVRADHDGVVAIEEAIEVLHAR